MAASIGDIGSAAWYPNYLLVDDGHAEPDPAHPVTSSWVGKGAKALGLVGGQVDRHALRAVLEGRVPEGRRKGRPLGRRPPAGRKHRPGRDLTLSAPKSVSIMGLVAGDRRIVTAHDRAVGDTLEWIERALVETRKQGAKKGKTVRVGGQKMLAATFRHTCSRNHDPQLHTHCAIVNRVLDDDGKWRAMANEKLYQQSKTIGAVYLAALARELKRLGYGIRNTAADGRFEIHGVPRNVIEAFSTRRADIEAELARTASCGHATPADEVAWMTRAPKRVVDRAEIEREWRHRASELGFSGEAVVATVRTRACLAVSAGGPGRCGTHRVLGVGGPEPLFRSIEPGPSTAVVAAGEGSASPARTICTNRNDMGTVVPEHYLRLWVLSCDFLAAQEAWAVSHTPSGKANRERRAIAEIMRKLPDDASAERWLAAWRWPKGPACPHCGSTRVQSGASHPTMAYRCREKACRKRFSVRTATVMQASNLGYRVWAVAVHLSLPGLESVSSSELARALQITRKSASHLAHRLRKALAEHGGGVWGPVAEAGTSSGAKGKTMPAAGHKTAAKAGTGRGAVVGHTVPVEAARSDNALGREAAPRPERDCTAAAVARSGDQFNRILVGDARRHLRALPGACVDLSFWSPPYHVGKSYERHLSFDAWCELLREVIRCHTRIVRPGGFLVVNVADILCFPDATMPRFQADNAMLKTSPVTREQVLEARRTHPNASRGALGALLGCSEQTIQRRLEHNNVRGGKQRASTKVVLTGCMVVSWAEEAGLYLYDRRIWRKDPCWANNRWHSNSYRSVDEFEHVYVFWRPGGFEYRRDRLSARQWAQWGSRGVWDIRSVPRNGRHEAEFPEELAARVILLFSARGGVVIDPFVGSGTTTAVARKLGRRWLGIECDADYARIARQRTIDAP